MTDNVETVLETIPSNTNSTESCCKDLFAFSFLKKPIRKNVKKKLKHKLKTGKFFQPTLLNVFYAGSQEWWSLRMSWYKKGWLFCKKFRKSWRDTSAMKFFEEYQNEDIFEICSVLFDFLPLRFYRFRQNSKASKVKQSNHKWRHRITFQKFKPHPFSVRFTPFAKSFR